MAKSKKAAKKKVGNRNKYSIGMYDPATFQRTVWMDNLPEYAAMQVLHLLAPFQCGRTISVRNETTAARMERKLDRKIL